VIEAPQRRPARWGERLDGWGFTSGIRRRLLGLLVALAIVMAGMLVHPAYVIFRPGPVYDTLGSIDGKPVIEVKGTETYDASGDLYFTTVAVFGGPEHEITAWDYLWAKVQPGSDIRPMEEVYPSGVTRQQIQEQTSIQMTSAQDEAKAVAMRATGRTVPVTITIAGLVPGGPADGVLQKGDEIVSLAGKPVTNVVELRQTISAVPDGGKLAMVVKRAGAEVPVQVGTTVTDGRRVVGVGLKVDFRYPVDVTIHAGSIGGPSAGLMFSLGLYDKLTPGPLTGGAKIAGTGTIADDGSVGPIGGIDHKMAGARAGDHADWFLAPKDNCTDVRGHIPDGLHVVRVGSFDEAKKAIESIAAGQGAGLPGC
jgi:PDZ domain-containing protein